MVCFDKLSNKRLKCPVQVIGIEEMPKRKSSKTSNRSDFTINDCANAPKPVTRIKKASPGSLTECLAGEASWDQIDVDQLDVVQELNSDGVQSLVLKKNHSKSDHDSTVEDAGNIYPEIVWYLVSRYIKPEDVGRFAAINKTTHSITQHKSFWRMLFKRYCENHPRLPEKLRVDSSYKLYGLRERIIRALFWTYDVFIKRLARLESLDSSPHLLVRRRCVNVWYHKGTAYWYIFFKLKLVYPLQKVKRVKGDFLKELGRIDANSEEDTRVLQVTCQNLYNVPPIMGMILSSVRLTPDKTLTQQRLHLGFTSREYNISKSMEPEQSLILDAVVKICVYDWWHPMYPCSNNRMPSNMRDDESLPMLKNDFFSSNDDDDEERMSD